VAAEPPQPRKIVHVVGEQRDADDAEVGDGGEQGADAAPLRRGERLQAVVELDQVGEQAAVGAARGQPPAAPRGPGRPGGCG
jgi:hypothetical protein